MKIVKLLFVFVLFSALMVSCKDSKKEDMQDDAVEMTEEGGEMMESSEAATSSEASSSDGSAAAAAASGAASTGAAAEGSKDAVEAVQGETKDIEEMEVIEGVMTEAMADTPVIYPGCASAGDTADAIRACSKEKFIAFLKDEFNHDMTKKAGLDPGDHEIKTVVHIDEAGKCSALRVTSSNYLLEGEMKRVIEALPQMTPATEAGSPVPVTFVLPLNFKVN